MRRKKFFYISSGLSGIMLLFSGKCFSQNTNDPYSVYGIGTIDNKMYNRTSGMASTGLAMRSSLYLINNNPAGIAGLTQSFFVFNAAGAGKTVQFAGTPITADNSTSKDFWIKGISLSAKINKFWASSFGFNQFSNINYLFRGSKQVEGSLTQYLTSYQGDGGLNDYYWTNAVSIGKHFMAGIKSSFLAGSINQTEVVSDVGILTTIETQQKDYYYHLRFEYGGIYYSPLNKHWDVSLGAKFSPKTRLPSQRYLTVTDNGIIVVNDSYIKSDAFFLPLTSGAGIALTHDKKATLAADYVYENWNATGIKGNNWQYVDNHHISLGYEFSRQVIRMGQRVEKNSFQAGVYYNSGSLMIGNNRISDLGLTLGTSGVLSGRLFYNASLDVGQRGTKQNDLIRENYVQLTLAVSYREFLFSRGRKYD